MTEDKRPPSLAQIKAAASLIRPHALKTPVIEAQVPLASANLEVVLKLENLQTTGSFKVRGTGYKFLKLKEEKNPPGVIAMSAGNHAQGVAYHAKQHNIPATIVMPEDTPINKIEATRKWGAEVILGGATLAESQLIAQALQKEKGLSFVHPYDDEDIICGQGTCAIELFEQAPDCTSVIIPIGGGGLAAGMALALRALNPAIKIYGVQTSKYPSMDLYLKNQALIFPSTLPTLAEGIAVKNPGNQTSAILRDTLDHIFLVDEPQIEQAIYEIAMDFKQVVEGAGASAYAALKAHPETFSRGKTGIILTGGNIDPRIFSSILLRGMLHHNKLIRLVVPCKDTPGQLSLLANIIATHKANIIKINHQRLFHAASAKEMDMEFILEIRDYNHGQEVVQGLMDAGFSVRETPDF